MDKSNLFVSNFSRNLGEEDLRQLFSEYWELESVKIIMNRETWKSKWFGFVKFTNEEDAERAMNELNGKEVDGREIRINIAEPRPPREEWRSQRQY